MPVLCAAGQVIDLLRENLNRSLCRSGAHPNAAYFTRFGHSECCKQPIAFWPGEPYIEDVARARIQILLVDDDPDDVLLMSEVMRETRVANDLHVAMDGEEAMDFFYRRGRFTDAPVPDLVFLDVNLPTKDGRQVLAEIKDRPELRRVPVVVLETSTTGQDVLSAHDAHVSACVRKPLGFAALVDVFRSIEGFWPDSVVSPPRKHAVV